MDEDVLRERVEVLSALITALDNRDRLFDVVTSAPTEEARAAVMREFGFSEAHVLDLQVFRFAADSRQRLTSELDELRPNI